MCIGYIACVAVILAVFPGAVLSLDFAWLVADTLNALMAIPNLISLLLLLSAVIVSLTREYFADQDRAGAPVQAGRSSKQVRA